MKRRSVVPEGWTDTEVRSFHQDKAESLKLGHNLLGNCWSRKRSDVCKEHEEPRGECDRCPPCPMCITPRNPLANLPKEH